MNGDKLDALYVATGVLVVWVGWYKAIRPRWRRFWNRVGAAIDILVGRGPIEDLASGQSLAALQPLPERLAGMEKIQATQTETLARVVEVLERISDDHERRLRDLENVRQEQREIRRENTALFDAVARRDDDLIDVPSIEESENPS